MKNWLLIIFVGAILVGLFLVVNKKDKPENQRGRETSKKDSLFDKIGNVFKKRKLRKDSERREGDGDLYFDEDGNPTGEDYSRKLEEDIEDFNEWIGEDDFTDDIVIID